jgi:hypothetical protein
MRATRYHLIDYDETGDSIIMHTVVLSYFIVPTIISFQMKYFESLQRNDACGVLRVIRLVQDLSGTSRLGAGAFSSQNLSLFSLGADDIYETKPLNNTPVQWNEDRQSEASVC